MPSGTNWTFGTILQQATGSVITSGSVIVSGTGNANVTFNGGISIKLEAGFQAHSQSGVTFHARIQSCTPGSTLKEYIRLGNRIIAIENH